MSPERSYAKLDPHLAELLQFIFRRYGYDFQGYAELPLQRRFVILMNKFGFNSFSDIQKKIVDRRFFFGEFLGEMTCTVTSMFRDPEVFLSLANDVFPVLATYPSIRIWHAGCSSGEEAFSMAILLEQHGLLNKSTIYATDINPHALQKAKSGILGKHEMVLAAKNYLESGGSGTLGDHYISVNREIKLKAHLHEHIVFSEHNIVVDSVFAETHLILCRNVFIYLKESLKPRILNLFLESLASRGFLCASKEDSSFMRKQDKKLSQVKPNIPIYQKLRFT